MAFENKRPSTAPTARQTRSAQCAKALALLRAAPRHTYDFRAAGVSHPAARIGELIGMGFSIEVARIDCTDSAGFFHRGVALYWLVSEVVHDALPLFA